MTMHQARSRTACLVFIACALIAQAEAATHISSSRTRSSSGKLCVGSKFKLAEKSVLSFDDLSRYFSYYSLIPKIDSSELVTLDFKGNSCGSLHSNMTFYLRAGTRDLRRFRNVYQYENYRFFTRLFKLDSVRTVLDLGAHTGMSTMYFAAEAPHAQVVATESDLSEFALLGLNTARYPNVHLEYGAAWDRPATVKVGREEAARLAALSVMQSSTSSSERSLWQHFVTDVMDLSKGKLGEIVPSISVPRIMEKYKWQTIDFLKVDLAGAERVVFGDASAKDTWLRKVRCFGVRLTTASVASSTMRLFTSLERDLKLQRPRWKTGDVQVWCKHEVLLDAAG